MAFATTRYLAPTAALPARADGAPNAPAPSEQPRAAAAATVTAVFRLWLCTARLFTSRSRSCFFCIARTTAGAPPEE